LPNSFHFPLNAAAEEGLSLGEPAPPGVAGRGRVGVAGHTVGFDGVRWYCDLTVQTFDDNYSPFIRLALARYQPHALDDAKLSRVVLADFAQFLPDRSLLVTADPYHPRRLRVSVAGPVPAGPQPVYPDFPPLRDAPTKPTRVIVSVQVRDATIGGDLGWRDVVPNVASIVVETDASFPDRPNLALWSGTVEFAAKPAADQFRLLIREFEYISADWAIVHPGGEALPAWGEAPGRLVYAETVAIDGNLVS
jgi:hypothetical protein